MRLAIDWLETASHADTGRLAFEFEGRRVEDFLAMLLAAGGWYDPTKGPHARRPPRAGAYSPPSRPASKA